MNVDLWNREGEKERPRRWSFRGGGLAIETEVEAGYLWNVGRLPRGVREESVAVWTANQVADSDLSWSLWRQSQPAFLGTTLTVGPCRLGRTGPMGPTSDPGSAQHFPAAGFEFFSSPH